MADDAIGAGEETGEALGLDPAPQPRRRRALWAALAAIAVAAGAVVVNTTGDDDQDKLPIALGAGAAERSAGSSPMAADMSMAAWVTYVAGDDLPMLGGEGPAYRLDGSVSREDVSELAAALGLDGEIVEQDGSWRVETDHGTVDVYQGFAGSWWYSSTTYPRGMEESVSSGGGSASSAGSAGCEAPADDPEARERCAAVDAGSVPVVTTLPADAPVSSCPPDAKCVDPVEPAPFVPPADLPSEAEARQIALDLLAATGVDVDGAKVTVDGPYEAWYITVEPRVDGQPISGLSATVSVGSKGEVTNASGYLAEPESLGDYPIVDTRAAIDRLNAQMGGGFGGAPSGREAEILPAEGDTPSTGVATEDPTTTLAVSDTCESFVTPDGATGETCASSEPASPVCVPPVGPDVASDDQVDAGGTPGSAPITTTTVVPPNSASGTSCAAPEPYVPPEPVEIVLHEAEEVLVLLPATDESGDAYLVPGYRFRGDQDTVVDAVAVDDDSLAPPPGQDPDVPVTDLPGRPTDVGGAEPAIEPAPPVEEPQP